MRNYPLRNKNKQTDKKLAYILSRISEPPSYRDIYYIGRQFVMNIKLADMANKKNKKKMYIFYFVLTLKRLRRMLKTLLTLI